MGHRLADGSLTFAQRTLREPSRAQAEAAGTRLVDARSYLGKGKLAMFGLRSARGRATLVGLVLTVFLVGVTAFTVWQTQSDNRQLHELERASRGGHRPRACPRTTTTCRRACSPVWRSREDAGLVDQYRQAQAALEQDLIQARAEATNRGDEAQLAMLDDLTARMARF